MPSYQAFRLAMMPLNLKDVFRQSGVASNAQSGRIAFPLRFKDSIRDGQKVALGVQVVDQSNLKSNCYSIDLEFSVSAR